MNSKKIKILTEQKQKLKLSIDEINDKNLKLSDENKTLKKNNNTLQLKADNLSNQVSELNQKCYQLEHRLERVNTENILSKYEIETKDKQLNEYQKGINFKIENSTEKGEYDIVIGIDSMHNLKSKGWDIKYPKGREEYERKMKMEVIIIGVIGNRNKGKSFILQKL